MFTTASPCRVLVIEDDVSIAEPFRRLLFETGSKRNLHFDITITPDVIAAERRGLEKNVDIFVVDLGLQRPGNESYTSASVGLALIPKLLASSDAGIIVYSSEDKNKYFEQLMEAGVDDYIQKTDPVSFVVEKVIAVWRRTMSVRNDTLFYERGFGRAYMIGDWLFTIGNQNITNRDSKNIKLGVTEHEFLKHIVLSRDNSIDLHEVETFVLRRRDFDDEDRRKSLENLIYRLRRKIGNDIIVRDTVGKYKILSVSAVSK